MRFASCQKVRATQTRVNVLSLEFIFSILLRLFPLQVTDATTRGHSRLCNGSLTTAILGSQCERRFVSCLGMQMGSSTDELLYVLAHTVARAAHAALTLPRLDNVMLNTALHIPMDTLERCPRSTSSFCQNHQQSYTPNKVYW